MPDVRPPSQPENVCHDTLERRHRALRGAHHPPHRPRRRRGPAHARPARLESRADRRDPGRRRRRRTVGGHLGGGPPHGRRPLPPHARARLAARRAGPPAPARRPPAHAAPRPLPPRDHRLAMESVARLSELPEIANDSGRWQPLNQRLGITAFGVNGVVRDPEDTADIAHDESDCGHQEVYVVVAGRAAFRIGDAEVEAGPGDVVAVADATETRAYRALEPATRIVCFGAAPGEPYPYGEWITESSGG